MGESEKEIHFSAPEKEFVATETENKIQKREEKILDTEKPTIQEEEEKKESEENLKHKAGFDVIVSDECVQGEGSGVIAHNFYEGIELFSDIPTLFRPGEVFLLEGEVTNSIADETVIAFYSPINAQGTEHQTLFDAPTNGNRFSIPVYFSKEGDFLFSIFPGKKGTAKAQKITVSSPDCEPDTSEKISSPQDFSSKIINGLPLLTWNDPKHNLFRVEFLQNKNYVTLYIRNSQEFPLPLIAFQDFSEEDVSVKISANISGENSQDLKSAWSKTEEQIFTATTHVSYRGNQINDVELSSPYTLGETLSIHGKSEETLHEMMVIIDPQENFIEKKLKITGTNFSGSYTPKTSGAHIVEINRDDHLSLFSGGVFPRGMLPIIPDYFDLNLKYKAETLPASQMPEVMRNFLNEERSERKLKELKHDDNLTDLAEHKAKDMCIRDYMSHTDPDGKVAGDYREKFNIETKIGENIGKSDTIRSMHESLMRSALHRKLIINPEYSFVGFGFCEKDRAGKKEILGVQIFGT